MGRWIARRVLVMIPVLLGITIFMFVLLRLTPGDPVFLSIDPHAGYSPGFLAAKRAELGLDKPIPVQYVLWLEATLHGGLGTSFVTHRPVNDLLLERALPTLLLMGTALLIAIVVAVPAGILAALKQHSIVDYATTIGVMLTISIPSFFTGLVAVYVLSLKLRLFPFGGMFTPGKPLDVLDVLRHLFLPATILGLLLAGPIARYTRASMLEVLNNDYLVAARAKGLRERAVIFRHALPNALLPIVAVVGVLIPALIAGSVAIEQIFSWPGMGQLIIISTGRRDYPVLMGILVVVATVVLLTSLLTDILYAIIDPKIRFE